MKKSLSFVLSMLCASAALAEPPNDVQQAATALVNKQLVQRLKKADSKYSRFSRASPPPKARRLRVVDTVAQTDARGKHYVRFAIDIKPRFAEDDAWVTDAYTGCAYVDDKQVFVLSGDGYLLPERYLEGDGNDPRYDVCGATEQDRPVAEPAAG